VGPFLRLSAHAIGRSVDLEAFAILDKWSPVMA
jgi:hypothetical protein